MFKLIAEEEKACYKTVVYARPPQLCLKTKSTQKQRKKSVKTCHINSSYIRFVQL